MFIARIERAQRHVADLERILAEYAARLPLATMVVSAAVLEVRADSFDVEAGL